MPLIFEQLQIIKYFGSSMESDITLEDIKQKERELGGKLPTALREVYLTFHEKDPVFSAPSDKIIPLDKLSVYQYDDYKLVSFLSASMGTKEIYQLGFLLDSTSEDDPYYAHYSFHKIGGQKFLSGFRIEEEHISSCLLNTLGWHLYNTKPNSIYVHSPIFSRLNTEDVSSKFKLVLGVYPDEFLSKHGFIGYNEELSLWMVSGGTGSAWITIPNPDEIGKYMEQIGIINYEWDRQNGKLVTQKTAQPPLKKRPLCSLQPILDVICCFSETAKQNISQDEIKKEEQRLGISFPAPLMECYCQAPLEIQTNPDTFLALEDLKVDKDKKIKFLVGEQGEPEYAFEADSPVVYQYDVWDQEWKEHCLMDGFLASELFWNTMNQEKLGIVLTEFPNCTKRTFGAKGKLGRFLIPVGKELTKEGTRFLFVSLNHKILVLYDDEMKSAYLASIGESPLKQLEKDAKIDLSWL